jgi:choline dehydrogenase-like flavoprotein
MNTKAYDVVVVGSGAGGGAVAEGLIPLARAGYRILVVEQGARLALSEFTGKEDDMADSLYEDGGGFLTADGAMTLAFGRVWGGSTVVYTGTSLIAPKRVIDGWGVPGLAHADVERRSRKFMGENGVHLLEPDLLNDNNRLFAEGCAKAGFHAEQFPLNLRGCRGSSLCNLGCPNGAKQGTHVLLRVSAPAPGEKGAPSEWAPGDYAVSAKTIVAAGGSIGTTALLLRSGLGPSLPRLGAGFTCHPAHILVAEHDRPITNDVGHPKSFFLDRAVEEGYVLETCMYFPFITAKNLTGFGVPHATLMRAFPCLQMILVLACDKAVPENRISVDADGKAVVHYSFTKQTVASLVKATRAAARIFFAAGALRVHAPSADPPLLERAEAGAIDARVDERHFRTGRISVSAAHLMGGCGMGASSADSVADSWGRVHGRPGLFVADSSLFPDSLEINPYLTVMALADRAAERIREDAGALLGPPGGAR